MRRLPFGDNSAIAPAKCKVRGRVGLERVMYADDELTIGVRPPVAGNAGQLFERKSQLNLGEQLCVYVISLGGERLSATQAAFRNESFVYLVHSPGVLIADLPRVAAKMLTGGGGFKSGALGCFMAHVLAWEKIAGSIEPWSLIVEDDVEPCDLGRLHRAAIPDDAEIVWLNRRMDCASERPASRDPVIAVPARDVLKYKVSLREPPGGDGYMLSRAGAGKLLDTIQRDGMHGHVDWRLLRYAVTPQDVSAVCGDSWMRTHPILRPDGDQWRWNVMTGYAVSPHLIRKRAGIRSVRRTRDGESSAHRS